MWLCGWLATAVDSIEAVVKDANVRSDLRFISSQACSFIRSLACKHHTFWLAGLQLGVAADVLTDTFLIDRLQVCAAHHTAHLLLALHLVPLEGRAGAAARRHRCAQPGESGGARVREPGAIHTDQGAADWMAL